MDNFRIDVTCEGDEALRAVMTIAFTQHRSAVGWRLDPEYGMILYWTDHKGTNALPFPHDAEATFHMVKKWLETQDYGREPGHDGSNGKGFRVYNEAWGHIGSEWQAFLAIKPEWAWYGK